MEEVFERCARDQSKEELDLLMERIIDQQNENKKLWDENKRLRDLEQNGVKLDRMSVMLELWQDEVSASVSQIKDELDQIPKRRAKKIKKTEEE